MNIVTQATNSYTHLFSSYVHQFLQWGQWLFFSLLTLNIVWMVLGYAFDRHALAETLPSFLKRFFSLSFFYTLMIHPEWLGSLLETAQMMGQSVVHAPLDPSSIIAQGIGLGNKLMIPASDASLITEGVSVFMIGIAYLVVLFVFISIALDLALTLIMTTALISMATFFLGFAALSATQQIARQTLEVILANCVKLLGMYLVVAAGSQTITAIALSVPADIKTLDPYAWIVAVAVLFWLLAKHLPQQLARIFSGAIQETHGESAAALMMAVNQLSNVATSLAKVIGQNLQGAGKLTGSLAYNALQHLKKATMDMAKGHPVKALGSLIGGTIQTLGRAVGGTVSDHIKHAAHQYVGGEGHQQPIQSISSRLYQASQDLKANMAQAKAEKSS